MSSTREEILQAARTLLEKSGYHGVGLEQVARAAGVSRQAVYLHFGSKSKLLLALVDWVDESHDLGKRIEWVQAASDPVEALERMVEVAVSYAPQIHKLALVLESARREDKDAEAAWNDRMAKRRFGCHAIVKALSTAGRLAQGWTVETATDFMWTLISVQTYENLVGACGWSTRRAVTHLKRVAVRALVD